MARSAKKPAKQQQLVMQHFIFEIRKWVPSFSLSVNRDKFRDTAYREYVGIDLNAACVFPQSLVGRTVKFYFVGDRHCLNPAILEHEPDWKPRCVGALELSPSRGHFYVGIPHESIAVIPISNRGSVRYRETSAHGNNVQKVFSALVRR